MYRYIHNHYNFHCHFSFRSAAATAHPFRFIRAVRNNVSSTALDCCPSAPAPSSGKQMPRGSPSCLAPGGDFQALEPFPGGHALSVQPPPLSPMPKCLPPAHFSPSGDAIGKVASYLCARASLLAPAEVMNVS